MPPAGRYDDIRDIDELISSVAHDGLSVQQHDLNRVADIVGNTTHGKLAEVANSDKRYGNRTAGAFVYSILFKVWHYEQAVSFYNEHTLHVGAKYREAQKENSALKQENDVARKKITDSEEEVAALRKHIESLAGDNGDLTIANSIQANTITALKAKLYDLMTAGA
jgi:hypothetical protein